MQKLVEKDLQAIREILSKSNPPDLEDHSYCPKCAYYEICYC